MPIGAMKQIRLFSLIMGDLALSMFVGLLVYEDRRRWPVLVLVVPIALLVNVIAIKRILHNRQQLSLPIVYGCGFLFGLGWTIQEFDWWKLLLLPIPLAFMIYHLRTAKSVLPRA